MKLVYGHISEIDASKGLARVKFTDTGIVSSWLPMLVKNTKDNQDESWNDENEHVGCLMDDNLETGIVMGSVYDENNQPPVGNKDKWVKTFKDGLKIEYDRSSHELTIDGGTDLIVNVTCKEATITADSKVTIDGDGEVTGDLKVSGKINADGNIKSAANIESDGNMKASGNVEGVEVKAGPGGIITLTGHKHPTAAPGPPSPPIP